MRLSRSCCRQHHAGWLLLAPLVAIGISAGCGGSPDAAARVTGEVRLDGQPLPPNTLGSVSFQPMTAGAGRATSAPIVDSRYDCPNVPKGNVVAFIRMAIPTGRTYRDERTGKEVSALENVVLAADEEDGIEVDVLGDKTVNFDLHRAKRGRSTPR